jgi:hypothetical protein
MEIYAGVYPILLKYANGDKILRMGYCLAGGVLYNMANLKHRQTIHN